jgi:hypothetical protein
MPNEKQTPFIINRPNIQKITVPIVGTSPLIMHKFSEKAKKQMLDKQMKKAAKKTAARDPQQEFKDSIYRNAKGKVAFPANAVKQAIVSAARSVDGLPMTVLRASVFVKGDEADLIPVKHKELRMREDTVKIGQGTTDLRFRGEVLGWTMDLPIEYNADVISAEQVLNLLQIAGFSNGLGEWRPERNGNYGTFTLATDNG